MSVDPLRLGKFVCVATAHADGRADSALTIHERAWAFCPSGADGGGHEWQPRDGLPLADALRLMPRQPAPSVELSEPATPATSTPRGRARRS
jgi:hypothetical protein